MTRTSRTKADPLERDIEMALCPGAFIGYGEYEWFMSGLEAVAAKIAGLADPEPSRAVALYETFFAGCYEKIDELGESSDLFTEFMSDLYDGWITARQAAGADPDETASALLRWLEHNPFGFCYDLERHAAKVLGKAGYAALVRQVRARFDDAANAPTEAEGGLKHRPEHMRRAWGERLRALYVAHRKLGALVSLAEEIGITARDCHDIAKLLVARRKLPEALGWAERGIDLDKESLVRYDLVNLRRELLTKLGRRDEALADVWAGYCKDPSKYAYDDLMRYVPKGERAKWHERAIEAAMGADLHSLLDLLRETNELARLADVVRQAEDRALVRLSHSVTEPVARKLEKDHPDLAARLWRAQGLRIVNAGKSKYYNAALANFESAKRCYERAGLGAEWETTVNQVRADHGRKSGFMPGFERLAAGVGPSDEPSFLERAKARWGDRQRQE
jgi:tetratricopeptide (TPR) repeat protein